MDKGSGPGEAVIGVVFVAMLTVVAVTQAVWLVAGVGAVVLALVLLALL